MSNKSIDEEVREQMRSLCDHVCHTRGLNPWVKECPTCGCANPKYDPAAVSDIEMPPDVDVLGLVGLLMRRR
jgi:hypothetical protein